MRTNAKRKIDSLIESAIAEELKHSPDNEPVAVWLTEPTLRTLEPDPKREKVVAFVFQSVYDFDVPIKKTKRLFSRVTWKNGHVSVFTSI